MVAGLPSGSAPHKTEAVSVLATNKRGADMLPYTTNKVISQLKSIFLLTLFFFLALAVLPVKSVYSAVTLRVIVSWEYTSPPPAELAGFRLYQDGNMIYQIYDPFAFQVSIDILVENTPTVFTITAFDVYDNESLQSTAFTYTPPLPSVDSDGDGLSDDVDPCPNDATNDADGDGVCVEDGDCDDYDPSVNPGTTEVCDDFVDNNCDGKVDEGCYVCTDLDGDNYCAEVDDCDDYDPSVNPGTAEVCDDGLDNNCDGLIDGADTDCGACVFTGREKGKKCNDGLDNDCNGLTDNEDPSCGTLLSEDKLSEGKGKTCRDGLDNDGDGQTDCDDIDCAFNRSCK
jgi:hypothetical protein